MTKEQIAVIRKLNPDWFVDDPGAKFQLGQNVWIVKQSIYTQMKFVFHGEVESIIHSSSTVPDCFEQLSYCLNLDSLPVGASATDYLHNADPRYITEEYQESDIFETLESAKEEADTWNHYVMEEVNDFARRQLN